MRSGNLERCGAKSAAAVLPDAVKRRHERLVVGRRSRANAKSTAAYLAKRGRDVRRGPLQGLRYPESVEPGDIVAKLVGSYEAELHPVFESWIDAGFEHVIDVGSAEGYYAAGLAHAAPSSTVHAFDIDPVARESCEALARANGIDPRLNIGEFSPRAR